MSSVDSTIDAEKFGEWIGLQTQSSKQYLHKQLSEWNMDPAKLVHLSKRFKRFKDAFDADPRFYGECHTLFQEIAEIEKKLNLLLSTESKLEKESYNEILFFRPLLQPLNFVPFFLTCWSFLRIYILPGMAFLVPFLTLIAPYIVLKFAFHVPITFQNYTSILHSMVSGDFSKGFIDPQAAPAPIQQFQLLKKFGIVIVTFIQGIIQPYWSYKHLTSIDQIITEHGKLVMTFRDRYHTLQSVLDRHGFTFFKCPLPDIRTDRDAVARAILETSYFKMALKYIGSLEVVMGLAAKKEIQPVSWVSSSKPVFSLRETFDFQVPEKDRKTISVNLTEKPHALLTGPNKGGKSTALRALSISALLAHTYGCAIGSAQFTPFKKMFVCLKPDDLPGSKSRFEREIEFTASTLRQPEPILIFIDELYHSTNPPDALRSCQIYCDQLWKKEGTVSVISTHLFELVEQSNDNIQLLCCSAHIDDKGAIHFDYRLRSGICKVSSVDELLTRNGLLPLKTECA
jgi:hypothetical protein